MSNPQENSMSNPQENSMSKPQRSTPIVWLSDEDFELIGVDPSTISDEMFEMISEELAEYLNENFQNALQESISSAQTILDNRTATQKQRGLQS